MLATVHAVDLGPGTALRTLLRPPSTEQVPGLRWAQVALLAPLAMAGPPPVRRVGLFAFWDDDAAVDRFVAEDPVAARFAGGLRARLRPLRAYGAWPGLPDDLTRSRSVPHDGPVVVFTLGRLRLSQGVRFLRASRPAERAAIAHPGMVWGSAAARPPFVATVSIWSDTASDVDYAYGSAPPDHDEAIRAQRRKDFHRQSAFVRFAPTELAGDLTGTNPLSASDLPEIA